MVETARKLYETLSQGGEPPLTMMRILTKKTGIGVPFPGRPIEPDQRAGLFLLGGNRLPAVQHFLQAAARPRPPC
jgi:hypothetical protein